MLNFTWVYYKYKHAGRVGILLGLWDWCGLLGLIQFCLLLNEVPDGMNAFSLGLFFIVFSLYSYNYFILP